MIVDCFLFLNELDLLELRLATLSRVVDRFVIVESVRTFSNLPKKLYYDMNRERYARWAGKIVHVVVTDGPQFDKWGEALGTPERFKILEHQYAQCVRGLEDVKAPAAVMIGDVDEIPRPRAVRQASAMLADFGLMKFRPQCYFYYINGRSGIRTVGPMMSSIDTYRKVSPRFPRLKHPSLRIPTSVINNGAGWHFSYLGGARKVSNKIAAAGHAEIDTPAVKNLDNVRRLINDGIYPHDPSRRVTYVPIDESFPKYVTNHPGKFDHLIRGVTR